MKNVSVKVSLFGIEKQNIGKVKEAIRKNEATITRLETFVSANKVRSHQREAVLAQQVG